ncbi:MAG: DNA-processing protein DprA [Rubritalea sp.]|uniref:DNA-processing protein DprA n=1 Tax=Rubritalea sp. TaxID=2109375 RepID=UPI0032425A01
MNSHEATIALNMLPKIGPIRVRRLIERLGSAEVILKSSESQLTKTNGIGPETARLICQWEQHIDLNKELEEAKARGISIITQEDSDYPESLRHMYDPPLALYVWGELIDSDKHAISIVGSRRTTHYGQQAALGFSRALARSGLSIISGLARGIDSFAHRGALDAKGRTIAVIGSGLAQLYPPENFKLAEEIANGNGAVISEFPLQHRPDKKTFPMRNRIVAAWSSGVLVVECPKWSGSMITANLGIEMGKSVYAVPGPIDRATSAGCNQLIRDGASLVSCANDILEDLESLPLNLELEVQPAASPLKEIDATEQCVLDTLSKEETLIDHIVSDSQLPVAVVMSTLLKLEMKRLIRQLPGARYVLR